MSYLSGEGISQKSHKKQRLHGMTKVKEGGCYEEERFKSQ